MFNSLAIKATARAVIHMSNGLQHESEEWRELVGDIHNDALVALEKWGKKLDRFGEQVWKTSMLFLVVLFFSIAVAQPFMFHEFAGTTSVLKGTYEELLSTSVSIWHEGAIVPAVKIWFPPLLTFVSIFYVAYLIADLRINQELLAFRQTALD